MFDQIIVDWPWRYSNRLSGKGRTVFGSGASGKYRTEFLSGENVAEMHLRDLRGDPCMGHFWVTGPFLGAGLLLIELMGMRFVTIEFVWVKTVKPKPRATMMQALYSMGLAELMQRFTRKMPGHYTASNVELVLLGARGKVPLPEVKLYPQIMYHPPSMDEGHSRKPDDVHKYIDRAYPDQRCIELFARREWGGAMNTEWWFLGDELDDGLDLRESVPKLLSELKP